MNEKTPEAPVKLDIAGLIEDAGGAPAVADMFGIARTVPYSWIRKGTLQLSRVAQILAAKPQLKIEDYVVRTKDGGDDPQALARQVAKLTKRLANAVANDRRCA